jgi:hypothetical protein
MPSSPPPETSPRPAHWKGVDPAQRALLLELLAQIANRKNSAKVAT